MYYCTLLASVSGVHATLPVFPARDDSSSSSSGLGSLRRLCPLAPLPSLLAGCISTESTCDSALSARRAVQQGEERRGAVRTLDHVRCKQRSVRVRPEWRMEEGPIAACTPTPRYFLRQNPAMTGL